ncbi:hypothetical protein [Streptomyces sp. NBC_01233]|uniref:hypothetical protein n=1 Tax=Streptomyces sp. NBC_01233 TaxID=2903787 RepID=UPI002E15E5DE|nr:hypothetical protein OG332_18715 [Streptomyces sp. NBC_01233]
MWFTAPPEPDPGPDAAPDPQRRYLRWALPDDGRPPTAQAAAALELLSATDPRALTDGG